MEPDIQGSQPFNYQDTCSDVAPSQVSYHLPSDLAPSPTNQGLPPNGSGLSADNSLVDPKGHHNTHETNDSGRTANSGLPGGSVEKDLGRSTTLSVTGLGRKAFQAALGDFLSRGSAILERQGSTNRYAARHSCDTQEISAVAVRNGKRGPCIKSTATYNFTVHTDLDTSSTRSPNLVYVSEIQLPERDTHKEGIRKGLYGAFLTSVGVPMRSSRYTTWSYGGGPYCGIVKCRGIAKYGVSDGKDPSTNKHVDLDVSIQMEFGKEFKRFLHDGELQE
ncbi:hypothetical protein IAT40_003292 [Kwoniella sp. CBS 6097]